MSKIYDCFMFNGEFELLEIRLRTHWNDIDKFIIVEGDRTFRGQKKECSLTSLPENLLQYASKIKIIFFEVPVFKELDGGWLACALQRDTMLRGLDECDADDFVIFSEVDEILRSKQIKEATRLITSGIESVVFNQEMFCYYLNVKDLDSWDGPKMLKFDTVLKRKLTPQIIRNDEYFDRKTSIRLRNSGWHFQNLGGVIRVIKKLKSSCHHELGTEQCSNIKVISEKIKNLIEPLARKEHKLKVINIDESYPECIYKEQNKYQHLIYKRI